MYTAQTYVHIYTYVWKIEVRKIIRETHTLF